MLSQATQTQAPPRSSRSGRNRRRQPRVELELDVDLFSATTAFTGFSSNVSEGGIFVAWHAYGGHAPQLRERLWVSFTLPGAKRPIDAVAEVRWAPGAGQRGLGLSFVDLPPDSRRELTAFVELRAPLCGDA
jgi:uncharacterized protein (TIGR02266 family)